jgi:hypothetical protein
MTLKNRKILSVVDRNYERLRKKKNVVGIGLGLKMTDGKVTDKEALLIFVTNKINRNNLDPRDIIENEIDGIRTDVVGKIGTIQALNNSKTIQLKALSINMRERPVRAGASVSHLYVTAGTLGGFFKDKDGDVVLLSNEHVIAGENVRGKFGPAPRAGNIIIQPGTFDGGTIHDSFASLKKWMPLRSKGNLEDSAIAKINNIKTIINEVKGLGKIKGFAKPFVGQKVVKVGRSTGLTKGKIISVNASVCVEYDKIVRCFNDCIITTNMSQGGDSGSLLLDNNMNAVGLLFAGSDTVTIYNPISYPVKTYGLKIM